MWKRGEIAPQEQFLLFSTLSYLYISNFRSQITYSFVTCGCSMYCFPHSLNSDSALIRECAVITKNTVGNIDILGMVAHVRHQ